MPSTPPPPPQAVASKIAQAKRAEQTQGRVPTFVFIEMMCALLTVSVGDSKWVDQLVVAEDKTTPDTD